MIIQKWSNDIKCNCQRTTDIENLTDNFEGYINLFLTDYNSIKV